MSVPSTSELYLAYRQAKGALFFERRGVGLNELAAYESRLPENLRRLRSILGENGGWFDFMRPGHVWIVPKRLRQTAAAAQNLVEVGPSQPGDHDGLDVQLRLSPNPNVAIVEALYIQRFGPALDSILSPNVLGYRLDLRRGQLPATHRRLFEHWPPKYDQFRSAPLKAARLELASSDHPVAILSLDLASYYDTIDPSFLIAEHFVNQLPLGGPSHRHDAVAAYLSASASLLRLYARFRQQAARSISDY